MERIGSESLNQPGLDETRRQADSAADGETDKTDRCAGRQTDGTTRADKEDKRQDKTDERDKKDSLLDNGNERIVTE